MTPFNLLISLVAVALSVFWLYEVFTLMQMPDDAFPGRYDKPIWAAILLVLSVIGAALFVIWKMSVRARREVESVAGELTTLIRESSDTGKTT
jgi:hypothetical protein